jgi:hypothetical protein
MTLFEWLICGYAVFTAALTGAACFVALFGKDEPQRKHGLKVLRLLWISTTGGGGVVMLFVRMKEADLI